jgi:hypothetical protein
MVPIIYLVHGDAKICVLRKKKYKTFVTKVCLFCSCVSFNDLHVREKKMLRLVFIETNGPVHILEPWEPKVAFFENLYSATFVKKVHMILVLI